MVGFFSHSLNYDLCLTNSVICLTIRRIYNNRYDMTFIALPFALLMFVLIFPIRSYSNVSITKCQHYLKDLRPWMCSIFNCNFATNYFVVLCTKKIFPSKIILLHYFSLLILGCFSEASQEPCHVKGGIFGGYIDSNFIRCGKFPEPAFASCGYCIYFISIAFYRLLWQIDFLLLLLKIEIFSL